MHRGLSTISNELARPMKLQLIGSGDRNSAKGSSLDVPNSLIAPAGFILIVLALFFSM
jgi:hypothetical protein